MDDIKYDFCVLITTYNREEMLKLLLDDIFSYDEYNILVVIFDDGSDQQYNLSNYDVKYIKYVKNNGLKNVWRIITDVFKFCKHINSEYFIFLQDDLRLKDNFFSDCVKIYEEIDDENKISLETLIIESQRNKPKWTNFIPEEFDKHYLSQWVELVFICKYKFFEVLDFKINPIPENRWDKNPNLSCGVGDQMSHRLLNMGYNMYQVKDSLTIHDDHDSVFFHEFRQTEKLISK